MTDSSYVPGTEDIHLSIYAREDGKIAFVVSRVDNGEKLYGIVLPPEVARQAAEKLTLASWLAEDRQKGKEL
ncbi:hypothetical protein ACFWPU_00910 [Streptomyces sp. NPDC058471]|uniref:hypothetical protein n=1 Tax=Streptomyces sp. NPDC058471 TaxID=3346516 RepID=UPI00364A6EB3